MRRAAFLALVCLSSACGGSEFESDKGSSGGSAGNGGTSATGGTGGATSGGGNSSGGSAGSGNTVGTGGAAGAVTGGTGGGGPVPISIVNTSDTVETITLLAPTLTLTPAPTSGNAIIVGITMQTTDDGCTISEGGVFDNNGNTYARLIEGEVITSSAQGARSFIFIAENIQTTTTPFIITVNPDGEPTPPDLQMVVFGAIEVAGLASPPSFDLNGSSLAGGDATETTVVTAGTTAQGNELAVGVLSMRSDHTNMQITPEANWDVHHVNQNGAEGHPPGHSMISRVFDAPGEIGQTWTHVDPTRGAAGVIATFRGAIVPNP